MHKDFRPWVVYLICLGTALVFTFLFGLNSPLHTFNAHCDYQWFLTMGRGMVAGKVPYRDLFEQKGPLIFVLFAGASLFPNPQIAVWCLEVFIMSWFLYFGYRIARKFLSPWLSLLVVPLLMMLYSANQARGLEGACVEEYCLPIFMYGLLCFLEFLMERKISSWRRGLALGIGMGVLLWTKYTMLEFFIAPLLVWLVVSLIERRWKNVLKQGLLMLAGFLIVTLPIVIGFGICGALDDLWRVYFVNNLTNYTGDIQSGSNIKRVNPWENFTHSFILGWFFAVMTVLGLVAFAIQYWRKKSGWLLLSTALVTWGLIGFFCGYLYYYLPLYCYATLGVVYAVKGAGAVVCATELTIRRGVKVFCVLLVAVLSLVLALPLVANLKEINRPREAYAPLIVADMLAEYNQTAEEPATLFCYRMVDCGFYNAAGVVPNVYYYAENSFTEDGYPEMFAAFDDTIRNQVCDFVVMYRRTYERKRDLINQYYHPYVDNNPIKSTLPFVAYEPMGYVKNEIIVLFRN